MKKVFFGVFAVVFSVVSFAQNCPEYYPLHVGASWEQQNFNAKDKLESTSTTNVLEVINTALGYDATIEVKSVDSKKNEMTSKMTYKCENGIIYVDMSSLMDQSTMDAYKDMDIKVENAGLQYPTTLVPGTTLPDATYNMTASSQGFQVFSMNVKITDRKVVASESITVPAGTFQATKITYKVSSKVSFMNTEVSVTEWISNSAGVVRSENYDKNGKLMGYMVLSKLVN